MNARGLRIAATARTMRSSRQPRNRKTRACKASRTGDERRSSTPAPPSRRRSGRRVQAQRAATSCRPARHTRRPRTTAQARRTSPPTAGASRAIVPAIRRVRRVALPGEDHERPLPLEQRLRRVHARHDRETVGRRGGRTIQLDSGVVDAQPISVGARYVTGLAPDVGEVPLQQVLDIGEVAADAFQDVEVDAQVGHGPEPRKDATASHPRRSRAGSWTPRSSAQNKTSCP